jgi:hypothetical protein
MPDSRPENNESDDSPCSGHVTRRSSLIACLKRHKSAILAGWLDRITDDYHPDTASFLRRRNNRFANPVGHAFAEGTEVLFQALVECRDAQSVAAPLEYMVKIKAVQESSPDRGVEFISRLKDVVRLEMADVIREEALEAEMLEFEARVDRLARMASGMFLRCRQKIEELKENERRHRFCSV